MTSKNIALKPYLEIIVRECKGLTKDELVELVTELARNKSASFRASFLNEFQSFLPDKTSMKTDDNIIYVDAEEEIKRLLESIEFLREDIRDRVEHIENGEYEELDGWDWQDYDYSSEEEPDYISESQFSELVSFFEHAQHYFLDNQNEDAKQIYAALFSLIDENSDYIWIEPESSWLDICEERARYARIAYETSNQSNRLENFASAMSIDFTNSYNKLFYSKYYPLLSDVINTKEDEMPDLQSFCKIWMSFLEDKGCVGRPARLLIEIVDKLEGLDGVVRIARAWNSKQPNGYLYWLERLKQLNKHNDIVEVSKEALQVLEPGDEREEVCNYLIDAGLLLSKQELIIEGKREKFLSYPCDDNLLSLQNEAVIQNKAVAELKMLLSYFERQRSTDDRIKSLYLKVLLMAGKINEAFRIVESGKCIGWSYGLNVGLFFGVALYIAASCPDDAIVIEELIENYANKTSYYSFPKADKDKSSSVTFCSEILKCVKDKEVNESDLSKYFEWALALGKSRIEHIVSNQHRKAYDSAAQTLCSLAESYIKQGLREEAVFLIRDYCKVKFNRHSSFIREVKTVIAQSNLLQNIL